MYCPRNSNDQGSSWVKEEGNLLCKNFQFYFWWENVFTFLILVWVWNSSSVLTPPALVHVHVSPPFGLHRVFPPLKPAWTTALVTPSFETLHANWAFTLVLEACQFLACEYTIPILKKKLLKGLITKWFAYSIAQWVKDKWLENVMLSKGLAIFIICLLRDHFFSPKLMKLNLSIIKLFLQLPLRF